MKEYRRFFERNPDIVNILTYVNDELTSTSKSTYSSYSRTVPITGPAAKVGKGLTPEQLQNVTMDPFYGCAEGDYRGFNYTGKSDL